MCEVIFERIWNCCDPYDNREPWGFLRADASCRRCPEDGPAALELLSREYSAESLISSGVAQREANGSLGLVNPLVSGSGGIVALRATSDGPPYELLLGSGCLSGRTLAITASKRDHLTETHLQQLPGAARLWFLTFGIEDLVLLRSLKLPATLAAGLGDLRGEQVDQLSARFRWNAESSIASAQGPRQPDLNGEDGEGRRLNTAGAGLLSPVAVSGPPDTILVLVGFSLTRLQGEEPSELAGVAGHLAEIERYLDLDLSRVCVWKPTEEELKRLQFLVGMNDTRAIRRAILDSVTESSYNVGAFFDPSPEAPRTAMNYLTARTVLDDLQQDRHRAGQGGELVRRAEAVVQRMAERDLVRPLIEKAQCCDDALERNLYAVSAELARQLHRGGLGLAEEAKVGVQGLGKDEAQADEDRRSKRFFRAFDRFLAVARELRK